MTEQATDWKQFVGKDPIWCPGCGDFGVLRAVQKTVAARGWTPADVCVVSGIGCSGVFSAQFQSWGFHGLHGRSLPAATGIKLANPELPVIVVGGDGDGYGIGAGHFLHAARRNVDLTYIVMDNGVYGLTKGQTSPTTDAGMTTKASPLGPMADPINPMELSITAGASYVAQGFSGDLDQMTRLIDGGLDHRGFAHINIHSPCVTYNHLNTYAWYRDAIADLAAEGHDPADRAAALAQARREGAVPTGLLYQTQRPSFAANLEAGPALKAARDPGGAVAEAADRFRAWGEAFQVR